MNAPQPLQQLLRPMPLAMLAQLQARFGPRCSTAASVREQHGRGESVYDPAPPEAVVYCESTEDVAYTVALCHEHAVPVIPFGVGSSLEGHLLAVQGGVSLDLSRMTRVVAVNPEDLTVTVQAGVTREQVNREIKDLGLFFPIDPGANASLGGMCATRASGTNAVRYGTMRENVLGLQVVTASGEVIHTGSRARKSAAGCGRPATRPISPRCSCARAAAARAATPACPSRAWPRASTTPSPRPKLRASRTGSSATWATATSTSAT